MEARLARGGEQSFYQFESDSTEKPRGAIQLHALVVLCHRRSEALGGCVIDEGALQEYARQAIQTGKLPGRAPSRLLGGNGFGTHCVICGNLVNPDDIGYELQFAEWDGHPATVEYHLHVRCFNAWDQECRRRLGLAAATPPLPAAPEAGTISDRERQPYKR